MKIISIIKASFSFAWECIRAIFVKKKISGPITPRVEISNNPGLGCPQCGFKIPLSIQQLVSGQPFYCPNCFLEICVDKDQSTGALNELNKLNSALQRAEKIRAQVQA